VAAARRGGAVIANKKFADQHQEIRAEGADETVPMMTSENATQRGPNAALGEISQSLQMSLA
jgi:hypothetical protein